MTQLSCAATATGIVLLHRRTLDRAVRTENAAISGERLEQSVTCLALVEPLACIGGHALLRGGAALRASDDRLQFNARHAGTLGGWEAVLYRPQRGEVAALRQAGRASGQAPAKHGSCRCIAAEKQRVRKRRKSTRPFTAMKRKICQCSGRVGAHKGIFLQLQRPKSAARAARPLD